MDSKYTFQTELFGVNDSGIHLLRSGYNYKSFPYTEIESVEFRRGKVIKNWLFLLLFGVGCILFSGYYAFVIFDFFTSEEGGKIYIEEIVVPLFPALAGVASLWMALKTAEVTIVRTVKKKLLLDLTDLVKKDEAKAFSVYFIQHVGNEKIVYSTDLNFKTA
ncbi:hypothetical protein [Pontibacter anaerobius]|uniref:Uncharacterized protein n=1 Tax=Pontibacter anaerobius TaxID=2993940 RepID=A0ABT3RIK7_9BACT|nr:hypothetical protein [Pontibacter anaerobius]MCX2741333.1 hypothetical protein [Pontibacter anaerobius]